MILALAPPSTAHAVPVAVALNGPMMAFLIATSMYLTMHADVLRTMIVAKAQATSRVSPTALPTGMGSKFAQVQSHNVLARILYTPQ